MEQQTETQTRKCIICKNEKPLQTHFRYTSRYKCYTHTCKNCQKEQELERLKRKRDKGEVKQKTDYDLTIKKTCSDCNKEKIITDFNFHKTSGYFHSRCKECQNKMRRSKYENLEDGQKQEFRERWKEYSRRIDQRVMTAIQNCNKYDKSKNYENDLDKDFVKELMVKNCTYCGFPATGLDRIDCSIGHLKHNCIPACWDCNAARGNRFSVDEMKIIGIGIHEIKRMRLENKENISKHHHYKGE